MSTCPLAHKRSDGRREGGENNMNKFIVRVGTGVATAALFAASAVPSFAVSVTNVGGGAFSTSGVSVNTFKMLTLLQGNTTNVSTGVVSNSNSGNNNSSFNTNGSNGIVTGPATTGVVVGVSGNTNIAGVGCGCVAAMPSSITNVGGGAFSNSGVTVNSTHLTTVGQSNTTSVGTSVVSNANTGGNSTMFNTNGNNGIMTGGTSTGVTVQVGGSGNSASL